MRIHAIYTDEIFIRLRDDAVHRETLGISYRNPLIVENIFVFYTSPIPLWRSAYASHVCVFISWVALGRAWPVVVELVLKKSESEFGKKYEISMAVHRAFLWLHPLPLGAHVNWFLTRPLSFRVVSTPGATLESARVCSGLRIGVLFPRVIGYFFLSERREGRRMNSLSEVSTYIYI